jgi:hypothetical protein
MKGGRQMKAPSIVKREIEAARRRAERAWDDLEQRRAKKLEEVTKIENELAALHPVMRSLFA